MTTQISGQPSDRSVQPSTIKAQISGQPAVLPTPLSTAIEKKILEECEVFLKEARTLETVQKNKVSILSPYHEQILYSYDNNIKVTTILKVLKGKGVNTSYGNLRTYISNNRAQHSPKIVKDKSSQKRELSSKISINELV